MLLRGEVYDPPRAAHNISSFSSKDVTDPDVAPITCLLVELEVFGECLLEHQSDTLAHHANRVDGVDEGLNLSVQKVAVGEYDHQKYHPRWLMMRRETPALAASLRALSRSVTL